MDFSESDCHYDGDNDEYGDDDMESDDHRNDNDLNVHQLRHDYDSASRRSSCCLVDCGLCACETSKCKPSSA